MKNLFILFFIVTFAIAVFPQKSKTSPTNAVKSGDEKSELEKAVKITKAGEKIDALQTFIQKYPKSTEINRARELIISARAAIAEEKLKREDFEGAIELYKKAIIDAPTPISDESFAGILSFPRSLYLSGQILPAYDVADLIQARAAGDSNRLLALATFYIQIENGVYAKKLAEQALEISPDSAKAYQTLGFANRLIFYLVDAAAAFQKAAELEGEKEASAKRDLADLKRALGKPVEAIEIYRKILEQYPDDVSSRTGLTLALFDAGNKDEAEAEMQKTLDTDSNNLTLMVGAAYWYAAHNQPDKAISLAKEAIVIEPRYVWSYIAYSRALLLKNDPIEAEKILLDGRQYGNFPTLSYEIATVRLQAGFYREAVNELRQAFDVKDGILSTKLGGRVTAESDNFGELLQLERQASIFQNVAADSTENAEKLKSLLIFSNAVTSESTDTSKVSETADNFIKGEDKMKFYRQIFTASRMLEENKDIPKVKEIVKSALPLLDSSLEISNPSAAVLADELYAPRNQAISKGELLIIPSVPKQTLQTVLRGRIEEISGWAEQREANPERALVHYKRGLSILPKDSAMWHSTMWRMGESLQAQGKKTQALDSYVQSYKDTSPNAVRYLVIESLYKDINGSTEGLENKIGAKPTTFDNISAIAESPTIAATNGKVENLQKAEESEIVQTEPSDKTETVKIIETKIEQEIKKDQKLGETEKIPTGETQTELVADETKISEPVSEIASVPIANTTLPAETTVKTVETEINQIQESTAIVDNNSKPEIKIENPAENAVENKTENGVGATSVKTSEKPVENSNKSLFEPIIIGIPKTEKSTPIETNKPEESKTRPDGQTRMRVISDDKFSGAND